MFLQCERTHTAQLWISLLLRELSYCCFHGCGRDSDLWSRFDFVHQSLCYLDRVLRQPINWGQRLLRGR